MKPKIEDYIVWLNEQKSNLIQLYFAPNRPINKCKYNKTRLLEEHQGSVMQLLEHIKTIYPEIDKIYIQKLQRKSGSFINRQELHKYELQDTRDAISTKKEINTTEVAVTSPIVPAIPIQSHPMGLMGQMGLGMPQIMSMHTAQTQLPKVEAECERLKRKCEDLEKENKNLERENMRFSSGIEGKPGAFESFVDKISENPDGFGSIIAQVAEAFAKKGGTPPGLGALPPTTSSLKNSVIGFIAKETTTDEAAVYAFNVAKAILANNTALREDLKKHFPPKNT